MRPVKKLESEIRSSGEVITKAEAQKRLAKFICMLVEWDNNPPQNIREAVC